VSTRRIAITGLGAISALGVTVDENWRAAIEGRSGVRIHTLDASKYGPPPHTLPLARVEADVAALVDERLGQTVGGALDPFAAMALAACAEALEQAGLRGHPALDERCAVILGHGMSGLTTLEAGFERLYGQRQPRLHPLTVPRTMLSAGVSAAAAAFGIHGPVFAVSSACASSSHAVMQAAGLIQSGQADVALAGGSEAITTPGCVRAWEAIHVLSPTGCRPFSADRDGMILGEGGGVLVLEAWEHAQARGAAILGEYLAGGMSSDALHLTRPSPEGQTRAIRQACAAAGIVERDDVLISAHGTATPLNDSAETLSIHAVFGAERGRRLPVIATKSLHGHAIGGSGALQAVLGLRALAEGLAPPIPGATVRDPACDLDVVVGEARPIRARRLLQNAFAFGGLNVALVFAGPEG
jgi:nodulation protein E